MLRMIVLALAPLLLAAGSAWDPQPWLTDLAQIRTAIDRDYPNREWLIGQREVSLDRWFGQAADAIRSGGDDAGARRALDRLIERFADGHVSLSWPTAGGATPAGAAAAMPADVAAFCAARGYDAGMVTAGTAAALPGYRPFDGSTPFAAGTVDAAGTAVGIVRIGVFMPQGYPQLCAQAVAAAHIAIDKPCDETCADRIQTEAYARMTRGLMATVERLRAGGAGVLMIDLTRNGGGSEWAEAAARIVSPRPLSAAPLAVIRDAKWVDKWRGLAETLRQDARVARAEDRATLADLARQADAVADGLAPCAQGACPRLAPAGYASGLLATAPAGRFQGKAWAADVFNAAQFPYRDSIWNGPVVVLVDSETWSAAEEVAAMLRDNDAAIVMGTRTGGAGCGHLDAPAPIMLAHSGATLELPNCVRFRKDGSNEVSGIVPDVSTGVRANDGAAYAARLTAARLPEAVAAARALAGR